MTLKLLFAFSTCLLLVACEKESDFIHLAEHTLLSVQSGYEDDSALTKELLNRSDSCIEVMTTHWLNGISFNQPVPESNGNPRGKRAHSKQLVIKATGDAMSETLARGFSNLKLTYDDQTDKVKGVLVTQFYYGEVLELLFDSDALAWSEGQTVILQTNVSKATLRTATDLFLLASGNAIIKLSSLPKGAISIELTSNTTLCKN